MGSVHSDLVIVDSLDKMGSLVNRGRVGGVCGLLGLPSSQLFWLVFCLSVMGSRQVCGPCVLSVFTGSWC